MKGGSLEGRLPAVAALRVRGTLLAALTLAAALAPVVEIHPHEGFAADRAVHGGRGETVFVGASHPASAPHAERAGTETVLRCPLCVLHLQTAARVPGQAATARLSAPSDRPATGAPQIAVLLRTHPGGSRAPPASR